LAATTPPITKAPDIVSPALRTLLDAEPVREAVIVPAEKSPFLSRITPVPATLDELKAMLPSFQILLPLTVNELLFPTFTSRVPLPFVLPPPVAIIAEL
jgi:hypothetical protein